MTFFVTNNRYFILLIPWRPGCPVLREAGVAIYGPVAGRPEGYFALVAAIGTSRLMHFSRADAAA